MVNFNNAVPANLYSPEQDYCHHSEQGYARLKLGSCYLYSFKPSKMFQELLQQFLVQSPPVMKRIQIFPLIFQINKITLLNSKLNHNHYLQFSGIPYILSLIFTSIDSLHSVSKIQYSNIPYLITSI